MNGAEMVRAEALARRFGEVTAVGGVSLSIAAREWVSLIGPSGCGKSTLMNVIGLLDKPSHGEYRLDGKSVARLRQNQAAGIRRDKIGFSDCRLLRRREEEER